MYALFDEKGKLESSYSYTNFDGPIAPGSYLLTKEQEENLNYLKLVNGEIVIDFAQKEIDNLKASKYKQVAQIKREMSNIEKQYVQQQLLGDMASQTLSEQSLQEQYRALYQQLLELEE